MRMPVTAPLDPTAAALRDFLAAQATSAAAMRSPTGPMASYRYDSMPALVLDRGTFWASEPLTAAEVALVEAAIVRGPNMPMVPRACYANCQEIIAQDRSGELAYCEGYVFRIIGLPHAWLDLHGKLIDPTLVVEPEEPGFGTLAAWKPLRARAGGVFPSELRAYCGLRFTDRGAILAHRAANQHNITLIDDWQHDWPLLTGEPLYGLDDRALVEVS